jgi:hypothetical protein
MKTIIHINQHNIRHNSKCIAEDRKPVVTSKTYKENTYCNELEIVDDDGDVVATLIYSPDKPLSCGAKVWIETDSKNVRIK